MPEVLGDPMKTIDLGGVKLPLDTVVQRKSIIAKNRVGKSNLACVYVEEAHKHSVQSIVLDPKGDWYGIRSSADGKGNGLPFLVMGGNYGDVPLDASAGTILGEYFGTNHVDVILDVSEFTSRDLARFGADFLGALYLARMRNRKPLNLVLEEAEDFAPQQIYDKTTGIEQSRCLGMVIKIAKKAGFLGIGLLLIAQRTASLNKNVLSQSDAVFFMRTTAPQDLKAANEWLQNQDDDKRAEVMKHIQGLQTGSAYVWVPEADIFELVQIRRRATFDSGFTPKVGETKPEPKVKAMVDLKSLMGQMAVLVEKAKADDPAALKEKIKDLQVQLAKQDKQKPEAVEKRVEVQVLTPRDRELLRQVGDLIPGLDDTAKTLQEMREDWAEVEGIALRVAKFLGAPAKIPTKTVVLDENHVLSKGEADRHAKAMLRAAAAQLEPPPSEGLSGPQQRILDAVAWLQSIGIQAKRNQVALVCEVSAKSGGYRANVSTLSGAGLLTYPGPDRLALTEAGAAVARIPPINPTVAELQASLLSRLTNPQADIMRALIQAFPEDLGREDVATIVGVSAASGGYRANVSTLSGLSLLRYPAQGRLAAHPSLFLKA